MFALIGVVVVFLAIIGGFLMEGGKLLVLVQPAELIIIAGSGLGTLLVANPLPLVIGVFKSLLGVISGSKYSKTFYLEALKMLNDIFQYARKSGMAKLEEDIEAPEKSTVFSKYPQITKDHHMLSFICDTLRTAVAGVVPPLDLDELIERDIEMLHEEKSAPARALSMVADSLPGLGIVAAVLGVVITMGALGGPPEGIGHKVAAALVGTFLGILLCYGLIGPLAANMAKAADEEHAMYHVVRVVMLAFLKGTSPVMAVEIGRRAIPSHVRPSFQEAEKAIRSSGSGGEAAAAASAG